MLLAPEIYQDFIDRLDEIDSLLDNFVERLLEVWSRLKTS